MANRCESLVECVYSTYGSATTDRRAVCDRPPDDQSERKDNELLVAGFPGHSHCPVPGKAGIQGAPGLDLRFNLLRFNLLPLSGSRFELPTQKSNEQ